ncbi:MAG TPA: hypothetical protein VF074_02700 [Pyrinomonadaceae bacterium]
MRNFLSGLEAMTNGGTKLLLVAWSARHRFNSSIRRWSCIGVFSVAAISLEKVTFEVFSSFVGGR